MCTQGRFVITGLLGITYPFHFQGLNILLGLPVTYVPDRHNSNISTQTVYTAIIQTAYNSNRFITLGNFNVLKNLLILAKAAIVLM